METAGQQQPWDGGVRLVREAVMLVATGTSPRVLVAGIAYGELVRETCQRLALESGARLVARPTSRGDRVDVLVEAIKA